MEEKILHKSKSLSIYDRYERLVAQPTERSLFFWRLVNLTRRTPSTVRVWLRGAQLPGISIQQSIAQELNTSVEVLFPESIHAKGSLVSLYLSLSDENKLLNGFLEEIASSTESNLKNVKRWMSNRHVPKAWQRKMIAKHYDEPIEDLFPEESATSINLSTPKYPEL